MDSVLYPKEEVINFLGNVETFDDILNCNTVQYDNYKHEFWELTNLGSNPHFATSWIDDPD